MTVIAASAGARALAVALPLRWNSYVSERGTGFVEFWRRRRSAYGERVLLIAGLGFDPRAIKALEALVACRRAATVDLRLLRYDEGPDSVSQQYAEAVAANREAFGRLMSAHSGQIQEVTIPIVEDDRRVGGRRIGALVAASGLAGYGDVIIDISALPRTLYFPLVRFLMQLCDAQPTASEDGKDITTVGRTGPVNLHVVLFEAPAFDARIREELTERADYLAGFGGTVGLQQDEDMPRVWAPVLGEGQSDALRLIEQHISILDNAPEICPVLPFPAIDPRRGDRLLVEYSQLFASWRVDLRNIIYASEHNPFDVYRQLCRLHDQYSRALEPLRGAKMIVSAHSSKLLSLGALLAAYDRPEIAVAHVEAQGYHVDMDLMASVDGELCEIWIAGEPYDA